VIDMAKAYTGDELAKRVFYILLAGLAIEIAAMALIGF
jgi:hypothetical protein